MKVLALLLILCSHLPLAWPCLGAVRNHRLPTSINLIGLSFVLYFDVEITFEAFGGRFSFPFFKPFFSGDDLTLSLAILALIFGPWIMVTGYYAVQLAAKNRPPVRFRLSHPRWFYFVVLVACSSTAAFSIWQFLEGSPIASARAETGGILGPWVIFLYAPLGVLAFYVRERKSHKITGRIFAILVIVLAMISALCMGERTMVLLPILIVFLFWGRISLRRLVVAGASLLCFAAVLLPIFKGSQDSNISGAVATVLSADIARGPVLISSIENSPLIGTRLMSYPGAGYVYSALLYVPRTVAPFKGESTATVFTAHVDARDIATTNWTLGITALDELLINFGYLFLPIGLFIYGAAFGFLDTLQIPVVRIATALSAIWLMGYNLPALLNTFGAIALFGGLCHWAFTKRQRVIRTTLTVALSSSELPRSALRLQP